MRKKIEKKRRFSFDLEKLGVWFIPHGWSISHSRVGSIMGLCPLEQLGINNPKSVILY